LKSKSLDVARDLGLKLQVQLRANRGTDEALKDLISPYLKKEKDGPKPEAKGDAGAATTTQESADTDVDRPQLLKSGAFNQGGDPIASLTPEANASVVKFAFSAKDGAIMDEILRTQDGYILVRLKERKATTKEDFDKDRDTFVEQLLAPKQAEALGHFAKRLREASKNEIKLDESYLLDQKKAGDGGTPASPFDDEE
jgi:hypothetical protein